MSEKSQISLQAAAILNVPLHAYNDFTFIVNGKQFKTTQLISELLSPLICRMHFSDPTINEFVINTKEKGDFSKIINLTSFKEQDISKTEIPFFSEVFNRLETNSIDIKNEELLKAENTTENVIDNIKKHEKYSFFGAKLLEREINFISSHFFEMKTDQMQKLSEISIEIIEKIINNQNLKLIDEDQLLSFINILYSNDSKFSFLYEFVLFKNVSVKKISEFLNIFNINDITNEAWNSISKRLKEEITQKNVEIKTNRYVEEIKHGISFEFNSNDPFNGINNYLVKESNGNIENKIIITSSKPRYGKPQNVILFNNEQRYQSNNFDNSFICFDYKENKVIPTNYIIKSAKFNTNSYHPKSWIVEGSNDKSKWETCDEQNNNSSLNGNNVIHNFVIPNKTNKEYRYIRIRQTQQNWGGDNDLMLENFELFGTLI